METLNVEEEYRARDLAMFADDILQARQDEICLGCGRTKSNVRKQMGVDAILDSFIFSHNMKKKGKKKGC